MTLGVLLAHVAARWAATQAPAHGWVPDESEIEMNERTYTREDMARAWQEGWNTCKRSSTLIDWGSERPIPNPYEQEEA